MNRLDCLIAGVLLLAPCSCQQEAPSAAGEPATEPVLTIDESLQRYGLSGLDDFAASVLRQIVAHAEAHDRRVFAISFSRDNLFTMWDEEIHLP